MKSLMALSFTSRTLPLAVLCLTWSTLGQAQPAKDYIGHDRTRPLPPVVTPAVPSTPTQAGKAPSDAVVLFDGGSLDRWVGTDGQPTKWVIRDGAMECVPGSGYIRTQESFGDCQFHIEFAAPAKPEGSSQGRGNSGLFFGGTRYEIQVLDSYKNETYADGSCASVYNQYPPLVNASLPPGQWQTYDLLWTAPRFGTDGALLAAPRVTLFHNGVLVQHDTELIGETGWLTRTGFNPHPEKLPISLQDHGNPVRFRNIWVRPLGPTSRPEFALSDALLDSYCGSYQLDRNQRILVARRGYNLVVKFMGVDFEMFAASPTRFFAKTVDVQAEFDASGAEKTVTVTVGEDEGGRRAKKID